MEYLKNLCNYYFVKEIKKDTETIISVENKENKDTEIKKINVKSFDVKSFDNQVINKINSIMFIKN